MRRLNIDHLLEKLSERDLAILNNLERFRLLTTRHIQRLHFTDGHNTPAGATRSCSRVLARLTASGLITHLERRIGGVRHGSAGYIWHLAATGERLTRSLKGHGLRRRYLEPSHRFVAHTLGIADLAVALHEAHHTQTLELLRMHTEPDTWQRYLAPHGGTEHLKPDLFAITATTDYEDHWFIEYDRGTEHLPAVLRQCLAYQRHHATGRHQAEHGLYPAVLWVVPHQQRADTIRAAITADHRLDPALHQTTLPEKFLNHITGNTTIRASP